MQSDLARMMQHVDQSVNNAAASAAHAEATQKVSFGTVRLGSQGCL